MVHRIKIRRSLSIFTMLILFCVQNGSFEVGDVKCVKECLCCNVRKDDTALRMKIENLRLFPSRRLMVRGGCEGNLACEKMSFDQVDSFHQQGSFIETTIKARRSHEELRAAHAKMTQSAAQVRAESRS